MNKRMKDPKGDLRFVHKSAQPSGFRVLKLTAMPCSGQAHLNGTGREVTRISLILFLPF